MEFVGFPPLPLNKLLIFHPWTEIVQRSPLLPPVVEHLVVRTADFRLAWRLIGVIHRRKIPCVQLHPDDPLPHEESVWVASLAEVEAYEDGQGVAATEDTIELAVERAFHLLNGFGPTVVLVFGVDPGPRPGLAWLADGMLVGVAQLEMVDDVADHIQAIATGIQHDRLIVRIGDGSTTLRNRISNYCLVRGLAVEFVDERRTSRGISRHHHHAAATRIALIDGVRINHRQSVSPAEGELRELQRRSRRMSEGNITISRNLAKSVAVGRLTMDEALERQRSK